MYSKYKEKWKNIWGYSGVYQISSWGKIKSIGKINRERPKRSKREKILKYGKTKFGYLFVNLYINGISKSIRVHRLVAKAFVSNPFNKKYVNHKKGNKLDNRSWMLEWVTSSENNKHAYKFKLNTGRWGLKKK